MESTGTIEATEVDVRSEVGGKIVVLHFDEGDRVRRGDVLAEIDHEKLDYQLPHAKERLREAEDFLGSWRRAVGRAFLIENELRIWYNPDLRSATFMVRGVICMIVLIVTTNLTALTIVGLLILSVSIVRLRKKVL